MSVKIEYKDGYFQTDIQIEPSIIQKSFELFLSRDFNYKKQFLQKNYEYGFDGYSYMGQGNSINQYAEDFLHSLVISEFNPPHKYPTEFIPFFNTEWKKIQDKIKSIEKSIIKNIETNINTSLVDFYNEYIGHMMSMNYYPKIDCHKNNIRLTEHKDVSLFSIFPFGIDQGLQIKNKTNQWINVPATNKAIGMTGFLLESLTNNTIKATNHRVIFNQIQNTKRFSFVFFSMPFQHHHLPILNCSSQNYINKYLNLF